MNAALVIRARNGFIYSLADGGSGTFPGDKAEQMERAGGFFDDMAEEGYWTETFYAYYASLWNSGRPWEREDQAETNVEDDR